MSFLIEQNMNFNFQPPAMFLIFDYHKNGLIKSCSFFEAVSTHKISWSHVELCKMHWIRLTTDYYEHNTERSGCIRSGRFLDQLSYC
jgi:hypothetical protein